VSSGSRDSIYRQIDVLPCPLAKHGLHLADYPVL